MTTNNTKNTTNKPAKITFRTKFEKLLTQTGDDREYFISVFQRFCSFTVEKAIHILWNMTYQKDATIFIEKLLSLVVKQEEIPAYRNELRYQYGLQHPGFLDVNVPDECQEAFDALKSQTDPVTANVVCGKCAVHIHLDEGCVRGTLDLLSSDEERQFAGGIRSLDFNWESTDYLKPFHMQIYDLLKALYEAKSQADAPAANNPLAKLGSMVKDAGIELAPDAQQSGEVANGDATESIPAIEVTAQETESIPATEVTAQETESIPATEVTAQETESTPATETYGSTGADLSPEGTQTKKEHTSNDAHEEEIVGPEKGFRLVINQRFKALSAEQILANKQRFNDLLAGDMSTLIILRDSGFDLNEITDKIEKIRTLIQVANDLSALA